MVAMVPQLHQAVWTAVPIHPLATTAATVIHYTQFPVTFTIQFPTTLTPSRRTYPNDYYSSTPISIASISPIIVNEPLSVACRFVAMTDLTDIDCFIIRSGLYHFNRIGIIDATDVFGFELDGTLPTEMELSTQLTYFTLDENQRKSLVWYWRIIFWSERFHPH